MLYRYIHKKVQNGQAVSVKKLIVLLAVIALAAVCALQWQKLSPMAGIVMWLHVLWLFYMTVLQLICLFGV